MNRLPVHTCMLIAMAILGVIIIPQVHGIGPDEKITVYNPAIANKLADRIPLVSRLDTIEGKTLYLVDVQWGGADAAYSVFEEMQKWFAHNIPSVKTVLRRTNGNIFTDDPELWKEIGEKGDAAIVGIAG